ncbi:MAG: T9SS type A sorting domain-containing protein [Flavobacteriales bacterium]
MFYKKLIFSVFFSAGVFFSLNAQNIHFQEDFSGGSGSTPPTGWTVNVVNGDATKDQWHFDNPGNRTFGNSISDGKFAIFDNNAVGSNGSKEVELISPITSVNGTRHTLAFYEFFEGGFNGKGEVYFSGNGGTSWVKMYTVNSTSIANPDKIAIDLEKTLTNDFTASMGTYDLQVKFVYTAPDDQAFWWILDDVMFYGKVAKDAAGLKVNDLPTGCVSSFKTPVTMTVKNLGSSNIDTLDVNYVLNGGDTITEGIGFDTLSGGNLNADSIFTYTFDSSLVLQDGNNRLELWPSNPDGVNDEFPLNDTIFAKTIVNRQVVANLPFKDGFEDSLKFKDGWCARPGPSGNGRVTIMQDTAALTACEGNNTAVLDAPGGASVDALDLLLNLSGCVEKNLTFTYGFMNDNPDPEDSLFLSVDGGGTFHGIYDLDHSLANNSCVNVTLNLDSVANSKGLSLSSTSVLRWKHAGNGDITDTTDGFYLDDVSVDFADKPRVDVEMLEIKKPNNVTVGDTFDVKVLFRNNTNDTLVGANVHYKYGSQSQVKEFWGGCLGKDDSATFTFSTALIPDTSGKDLCAWTSKPNSKDDLNANNDKVCISDSTSDTTSSVNEISDDHKRVRIYPNPANNVVNIKIKNRDQENYVITMGGKVVKGSTIEQEEERIRIQDLDEGMYFYTITSDNGKVHNGKLIIQKP